MGPARRAGEGVRRVEAEIVAEKAAALGRAGERLEQALAEVAAAARRRDAAAYERARARAARARLALLIQREAVGLRRHAVVDERFPEPPRRMIDSERGGDQR